MTDRVRLELDGAGSDVTSQPSGSPPAPSAADLLAAVFSKVSRTIAGDDPYSLPPLGTTDLQAEGFLPTGPQSIDPDFLPANLGDPFTPESGFFASIPDLDTASIGAEFFDPASLPDPQQGNFYKTSSGLLRYSIGVGEAPDNKANASHPVYQARAEFVSRVRQMVLGEFNVTDAGQHRDHNAPLTPGRSRNSDHYSGGAFDVRAPNIAEAQRLLSWASSQPWVSFAQMYPPDSRGILVHISANVGVFAGGEMPEIATTSSLQPKPQPTTAPSTGTPVSNIDQPPPPPMTPPPMTKGQPS